MSWVAELGVLVGIGFLVWGSPALSGWAAPLLTLLGLLWLVSLDLRRRPPARGASARGTARPPEAPSEAAPQGADRDLTDLTPREFELYVAGLIGGQPGWVAEVTGGRADQGADVLATGPGGERLAVQVKHYRSRVGNAAVQAIVASKALYGCDQALVVTSGPGYTRAAQELARVNGVRLWTGADLLAFAAAGRSGKAPPPGLWPAGDVET